MVGLANESKKLAQARNPVKLVTGMRLSKNRSGPLHWLLGRKLTGQMRMRWSAPGRPHRRGRVIPVRPGLRAVCFLAFWFTVICAWHGQAGEAPTTSIRGAVATDESPTNGL